MSFMSPGQVVWFEIDTSDAAGTQDFYGQLLGWRFEVDPDSSVDGRTYTRILAPGAPWPMGALYEDGSGAVESSISIFSADVDADVARLEKLGATVVVPATRVADVTWFARLRDPRGNLFSLFARTENERLEERAEATEEHLQQAAYVPTPGSFAWFEIGTGDAAATQAFYRDAFGWRFERDESAGGKPYYNIYAGNQWPSGGMYDHGSEGADYAMPSILVADVVATTARARELGGAVEHGPDSNPDGLVFSRLIDPQGNRFGLFSMPADPGTPDDKTGASAPEGDRP